MIRFIRIKTPGELLDAIALKPLRFFILLNYGAESSKRSHIGPAMRGGAFYAEVA